MYIKGEHGYFQGSTSEGSAERKASSIHRAASSESKKLSSAPKASSAKPAGSERMVVDVERVGGKRSTLAVIKNPSKDELVALAKDTQYETVRLVRKANGDVFAWNGDVVTHPDMMKALKISDDSKYDTGMFSIEEGSPRNVDMMVGRTNLKDSWFREESDSPRERAQPSFLQEAMAMARKDPRFAAASRRR